MGIYIYDGKPEGYCTGVGTDLEMLSIIMVIATFAVPIALAGCW